LKLPFTKLSSVSEPSLALCRPFPIWLRYSSLFTLGASVGFLFLSLGVYKRNADFTEGLVPLLLVALLFAVFLIIYSLWRLQREHGEADRAFLNTDCEFSSIFQNVLDGILIVNNEGDCLDANPAAVGILRISADKLIGRNINCFLIDRDNPTKRWSSFLPSTNRRGRIELVAGDGTKLFVDFTATANYLPGRHVLVICDVTERTQAELFLRQSEERFREMADNIAEIFWRMDARTQEITYVNRAYTTITGQDIEALRNGPSAYQELIHPEDRIRILGRLRDLATSGTLDEEFRFIRTDGEVRWIWAKGFPVPGDGAIRWLVGTAQDVTSRKKAELKIVEQLDAVEAARAEAEALRKSTLALSQNLAMDSVLDTLLQCMSELVPFDRATVLFVEDGFELMVAREAPRSLPKRIGLTLKPSENTFLERVLFEKRAMLLADVSTESQWSGIPPFDHVQSWMGVSLVAAGRVLGILSLGSNSPRTFTAEHLRLARSLAIPAAVAIQNARTHERAELYAAELQIRLLEVDKGLDLRDSAERKSFRSNGS
jgi:PAS domain S-box-containing protein